MLGGWCLGRYCLRCYRFFATALMVRAVRYIRANRIKYGFVVFFHLLIAFHNLFPIDIGLSEEDPFLTTEREEFDGMSW